MRPKSFTKLLAFFLVSIPPLLGWEGKVFQIEGKKVTIASSQTAGVKAGTRLYVIQDGKEIGSGRVDRVFHTKVEMTLLTGTAVKGLAVTNSAPGKVETKIPDPKKDDKKSRWKLVDMPGKVDWAHISFGNGRFVMIVRDGYQAAASVDGERWQFGSLPVSTTWEHIVFGNGMFIALAGGNQANSFKSDSIAISTDGLVWKEGKLPKVAGWSGIGFGNGTFVITETSGDRTLVSVDGINWKKGSLPDDGFWSLVTYGNQKFLANNTSSSGKGKSAISTDGLDWKAVQLPNQYGRCASVFVNGQYVTCAMGGELSFSADGETWRTAESPIAGNFCSLGEMEGKLILVRGNQIEIAISGDLATWSKEKLPVQGNWGSHVFGNGILVIIDYRGNRVAVRK